MEDLRTYLNHNYGRCTRAMDGYSCACIKHGWIGQQCSSWKPFNVSTYEELGEAQRNVNSYEEKMRRYDRG